VDNGLWQVNADGSMQTTWHLLPNLVWQDGIPFTTDDLSFTVRVAQDLRAGVSNSSSYKLIDRVDTPDLQTLTVSWASPFIEADALFSATQHGALHVMPLPAHLLQAAFDQDPTSFSQLPYWTSGFVGLGPFTLTEFVAGSHFVARANDRYALGRPKIDEIEVDFIPDPNTIAANLLAGSVDLTMNDRLDIDWGVQLRDKWTAGHMEPTHDGGVVGLFPQFINPSPALVADVNFREALMRAIDRQQLSDSIMDGMAPVAHSLIEPGDPDYAAVDPSVVKFDYDPRRAMQILDGLGLSKGADGVYRDASGQPLALELRSRAGDDLQEKILPSVADYWKQVGVGSSQLVFGAQQANDREFRATHPAFEVVRQPDGGGVLTNYLSAGTPTAENGYRGNNRTRYSNPDLDGLIKRFVTTIPLGERRQILAQAIGVMTRNIVFIPLDYIVDATMIANRISGVGAQNPAWNAHEWDVM